MLSQVHLCLFLHPHTPFFFGCTSLETNHQLLDFDLNFGPAIKDNKVSSTERVTDSASLNMLTMLNISWFLLVHWLSVPFRAMRIAFLPFWPPSWRSSIFQSPYKLHFTSPVFFAWLIEVDVCIPLSAIRHPLRFHTDPTAKEIHVTAHQPMSCAALALRLVEWMTAEAIYWHNHVNPGCHSVCCLLMKVTKKQLRKPSICTSGHQTLKWEGVVWKASCFSEYRGEERRGNHSSLQKRSYC